MTHVDVRENGARQDKKQGDGDKPVRKNVADELRELRQRRFSKVVEDDHKRRNKAQACE